MDIRSQNFKDSAYKALHDQNLQKALGNVERGFIKKRRRAREKLPEFDALRDQGRDIKNHTLQHLDLYLKTYEDNVIKNGGHVHWAANSEQARNIITDICMAANAKTVTKGKSMVSEEVALNAALQDAGLEVVETDLGEYIIQLRGEPPSHIIAPAVHLNKEQIEINFRKAHKSLPEDRNLDEAASMVAEARGILREKFIAADVGITGANLLIAETGSSVIVTNEGNGDLTQHLPRVHIVIASIEKIVPTREDASTILRLLARSATGQHTTTYVTFSTGPKRSDDVDGPESYHVVLLDNGRTEMLGSEFHDMLRCIRCGACMNHCPVYHSVGGHAYGWVYPGPMGAVLTPSLIGIDKAGHLPNASTFCGRCEAVCPVHIPLPKMMRHWREREFAKGHTSFFQKLGLKIWASIAKQPKLYHLMSRVGILLLQRFSRRKGYVSTLPFAAGWTKYRHFPAPQKATFQTLWKQHSEKGS
ncbi:MAG: LutB/LldF family L-lactate oxidation iron-sulfur protein [Pseudomonadota bacterium]